LSRAPYPAHAPPTPHIYTLSLHDALPISPSISPPTPAAPARTSAGTRPQPTPPTARSSNSSSPPSNANSPTGGIWTASTSTSPRSEEHTSELQSRFDLVCRLLLETKKHQH